ncbi:MAG: HlyD family efflux transporter periplasmic adaptor subunit [Treponema sp.]|nr:HlyD family efflux transporter periplasmic adaptor subunit [Treponema sp.]
MQEKTLLLKVEDMKLLPQTHDFFDTRVSKAVPLFILCVIVLFAAFFFWAGCAKMDDVVKADAVLRPTENISDLKCLANGEVAWKGYVQNQKVKKGDFLLSVDCSSEQLELVNIESQLVRYEKELKNDRILLECMKTESDSEEEIADGRNMIADSQLRAKIDSYFAEYNRKVLQVQEMRVKYESEKDMPSSLRLPKRIEEARNQLEQTEFTFENWKNAQFTQVSNAIHLGEDKVQNLKLRKNVLERSIKNANLYAPIDGTVDEVLALNVGDYVVGGSDVLRIIPAENQKLKAEIVLDASKIARVKTGQEVKLRFPGLPPSSFGQLKGKVSLIPADITVNSNKPVFIVEAEIPEPFLFASSGERVNLRSGLAAEARIVISRDSVIKMILRKLDFVH